MHTVFPHLGSSHCKFVTWQRLCVCGNGCHRQAFMSFLLIQWCSVFLSLRGCLSFSVSVFLSLLECLSFSLSVGRGARLLLSSFDWSKRPPKYGTMKPCMAESLDSHTEMTSLCRICSTLSRNRAIWLERDYDIGNQSSIVNDLRSVSVCLPVFKSDFTGFAWRRISGQ